MTSCHVKLIVSERAGLKSLNLENEPQEKGTSLILRNPGWNTVATDSLALTLRQARRYRCGKKRMKAQGWNESYPS